MTKSARRRCKALKEVESSARAKAALKQILHTYELLENVLRHLPIRDLLTCQSVCYKMNSTIAQSDELQQILFLKSIKDGDDTLWYKHLSTTHLVDNFPIRIAEPQHYPPNTSKDGKVDASCRFWRKPILINPLLVWISEISLTPGTARRFCFTGGDINPVSKRVGEPTAASSAMRMFLTQPPVKVVEMRYVQEGGFKFDRLEREDGVRFQDLMDHAPDCDWHVHVPKNFLVTEEEKKVVEERDAQLKIAAEKAEQKKQKKERREKARTVQRGRT